MRMFSCDFSLFSLCLRSLLQVFFFFLHMVAKNLNDCVECAPPELDDAARREDAEKKMMLCSL